ncbi:MAG TPA: HAD family hydrolase [Candidatus Paceibacterota bacterium]|nr:HAD family hydrolase [Candidatus Paceibacterota bacterium]HPT18118.1 HAD family hydrolase [Candidatus Paceibacterota bacterium]
MKLIIFDWSGVIKDGLESNLWICNKIFEKFGVPTISLEEFKENYELPYMNFFKKYIPSLTLEEERIIYKKYIFDINCPKSKSCLGIIELIKKLKENNYHLAVVSSDFPGTIFAEIKEYGLENIFDDVITGIYNKLEGVNNVIKKRNFDLSNTFFVGDTNHEIEVARQAGIKSIAVTWGFCSEQKLKLENPDYLVHNSNELEKILL